MSTNAQQDLFAELLLLLDPFTATGGDPGRIFAVLEEMGWDAPRLLGAGSGDFTARLQAIGATVADLRRAAEGQPPQTLQELRDALQNGRRAFDGVRTLPTAMRGVDAAALATLPQEL